MRIRWIVPSSVALVALLSVVVLSQIVSQALEPSADLAVTKSVSPAVIAPGRPVTYEVQLDNSTGSDLHVSSLVDTLPPEFEYVGLAPGSEWDVEPLTTTLPHIQWSGPITVPVSGLTLRYNVYVPGSVSLQAEPYTNTIAAVLDSTPYDDETGLLVGVGEISLVKSAARTRVLPGGVATYTLAFHNHGFAARDLDEVSDVLPPDVTFESMTADSDVSADPAGTTMTITWPGPHSVPPQGELVVEYEVTMPLVDDNVSLVNEAWGEVDGTTIGPDSVDVVVGSTTWVYFPLVFQNYAPARFTVSKTADPAVAYTGPPTTVFTYTVTLRNEGTVDGELADVRDTLPAGFEFDAMVTAQSDVDSAPSGTTGEIVWTGPFPVAGQSSLTLVYRVSTPTTLGTYVNSATATTEDDKGVAPKTPGQATVHISEPVFLAENWDDEDPYWEPYLSFHRLKPEQWYVSHDGGVGNSAGLRHNRARGSGSDPDDWAEDALYTYMGPGSEDWTNYRYEAELKLVQGEKIGLWFRGQVDEPEPEDRHVEGYYLMVNPSADNMKLSRIKTDENPLILFPYRFNNPEPVAPVDPDCQFATEFTKRTWFTLAVELRGSEIKAYVDGTYVCTWYDDLYTSGTVGMKTWKIDDAVWDNILVTPLP